MPILIVGFRGGAYGFGSLLLGAATSSSTRPRSSRAPGATEGLAQTYLGVFSPTRASYQLRFPGGALLSSPTNGDFLGRRHRRGPRRPAGRPVAGPRPGRRVRLAADDPCRERRPRAARPDGPAARGWAAPQGTVTNASQDTLEAPAVVLGSTVAKLAIWRPARRSTSMSPSNPGRWASSSRTRSSVRSSSAINGRPGRARPGSTPATRSSTSSRSTPTGASLASSRRRVPSSSAWSDRELLPVEIEGQVARRTANVLWFLPADLAISGKTTFRQDLMRNTVVSSDAAFFNKDPFSINFGRGKAELSFRPISFDGSIAASELALGFNSASSGHPVEPRPVKPLDQVPPACGDQPVEAVSSAYSTACPRSSCMTSPRRVAPAAAHDHRLPLRGRRAGALCRCDDRDRPRPVHQ